MEGTTEATHRWHMKKDGSINVYMEVVFTGSVLGESGSITMICKGNTEGTTRWTIVSGTDDLANLRGHGTLGLGWFEGYVHFDP